MVLCYFDVYRTAIKNNIVLDRQTAVKNNTI